MGNKFDIRPSIDFISDSLAEGKSIRMIAACLGIDHSTLADHCKNAGITIPTRAESAKHTWQNHRHPRIGRFGDKCPTYGQKQSRESVELRLAKISGPNNYHWSGGRKTHSDGYTLVYNPKHPCCDKNGYVLEHRLVMENKLGRYLLPIEIVHHINGIKDDNRPENLKLESRASHAQLHWRGINAQ